VRQFAQYSIYVIGGAPWLQTYCNAIRKLYTLFTPSACSTGTSSPVLLDASLQDAAGARCTLICLNIASSSKLRVPRLPHLLTSHESLLLMPLLHLLAFAVCGFQPLFPDMLLCLLPLSIDTPSFDVRAVLLFRGTGRPYRRTCV